MKVTPAILLTAHLATLATCQLNLTVPWATNFFSDDSDNFILHGEAALAYMFNYDPSVPHVEDYPSMTSRFSDDPVPTNNPRYDTNYVARVCNPRALTGEALAIEWELDLCDGMTEEGQCANLAATYEYHLQLARAMWAGSSYPCERKVWIEQECGINIYGFRGHGNTTHKGTFSEQNTCLCKSDYFAAQAACNDCHDLHVGNATLKEMNGKVLSLQSEAICGEKETATKSLWDYQSSAWESVYTGYKWADFNTTIVSDGAQNKTDVSLYMTEAVDFVPATIQEPPFTRTIAGKETVMTPGALKANAKAFAKPINGEATATRIGAVASAPAEEGGAVSLRVEAGLVAAVLGAFLLL